MTGLIEGVAAALLRPNINTDVIAPAIRDGQNDGFGAIVQPGTRVFGPWRYLPDGRENPDFVLNREPFRHAAFLIAGENFACGSSRETAVVWLRAFGIRCVIAPSFGGIFFDNCFRHGILPLILETALVERLARQSEAGGIFALDLDACRLDSPKGPTIGFNLPDFRRSMLIDGADELTMTLNSIGHIDAVQQRLRATMPWIWPNADERLP